MTQFQQQQASLTPGAVIQLFTVDATAIGGSVYYLTPEPFAGSTISFQGQAYVPYPVQVENFEISGKGPAPRPKLRIDNAGGYVTGLLIAFGDLKGAKVTRIRTLVDFLDGQRYSGEGDPATWAPEIFYINQKTLHNKQLIEFELCILTDVQQLKLPGRQVIRDSCTHTYRSIGADGSFSYANVSCPYVGGLYYTEAGTMTTDPTKDVCGRKTSDCKLRFGQHADLPTWAFPGILLTPLMG